MVDQKRPEKLPYETPVLKRVELRTEEVLGVGCKTTAQSNVGGDTCDIDSCNLLGS